MKLSGPQFNNFILALALLENYAVWIDLFEKYVYHSEPRGGKDQRGDRVFISLKNTYWIKESLNKAAAYSTNNSPEES